MEGSSRCRFQLIKSETALINKSCREKSLERERERGAARKALDATITCFQPPRPSPFFRALETLDEGRGERQGSFSCRLYDGYAVRLLSSAALLPDHLTVPRLIAVLFINRFR